MNKHGLGQAFEKVQNSNRAGENDDHWENVGLP